MTLDRFIHLIAGIIFILLFIKIYNIEINKKGLIYVFLSMALGTWVSDWDLMLGIGFHRSPLTHSLLPALIILWAVFKLKLNPILLVGFCLGLSSHLFWDIIAYGNVQWIKGGNNDRMFLLINAILLIVLSIIINKKYIRKK